MSRIRTGPTTSGEGLRGTGTCSERFGSGDEGADAGGGNRHTGDRVPGLGSLVFGPPSEGRPGTRGPRVPGGTGGEEEGPWTVPATVSRSRVSTILSLSLVTGVPWDGEPPGRSEPHRLGSVSGKPTRAETEPSLRLECDGDPSREWKDFWVQHVPGRRTTRDSALLF